MITGLVLDWYNVSLLNFPIPHSWQVSSLIQFILNNPDLPLVDHLSLYLSACPIRHPFQPLLCVREANVALFRGFFDINAARKLAAESLMRWQQLSPQIFQDSPLYFVFLQYLFVSTELLVIFFQTVDCLFGPRLCLSEVTLVLGVPSCAIMTQTDFVVY